MKNWQLSVLTAFTSLTLLGAAAKISYDGAPLRAQRAQKTEALTKKTCGGTA